MRGPGAAPERRLGDPSWLPPAGRSHFKPFQQDFGSLCCKSAHLLCLGCTRKQKMRAQVFFLHASPPTPSCVLPPCSPGLARAELFALPLVHHARDVTCMEGKVPQTTHPPRWRQLYGPRKDGACCCCSREVSRTVRETPSFHPSTASLSFTPTALRAGETLEFAAVSPGSHRGG